PRQTRPEKTNCSVGWLSIASASICCPSRSTRRGPRAGLSVAGLDALRERTHLRAFFFCQAALLPIVIPTRCGDNCVTVGPVPLLRMRCPVRVLILFSWHHSKNVRT